MTLNYFFAKIPKNVSIGNLVGVFSEDLKMNPKEVWRSLIETDQVQESIEYVAREFRKVKKEDEIKYAEEIFKLSELFGQRGVKYLLWKKGIKIGNSTIYALCRVALDTPKVKDLVKRRKLRLTDLFWIKGESEEREKIAFKKARFSR